MIPLLLLLFVVFSLEELFRLSTVVLGDSQGSCVGLYMINRAEWVISELACAAYSYVSVPLYDTLGKLQRLSTCAENNDCHACVCFVMLVIKHLVGGFKCRIILKVVNPNSERQHAFWQYLIGTTVFFYM